MQSNTVISKSHALLSFSASVSQNMPLDSFLGHPLCIWLREAGIVCGQAVKRASDGQTAGIRTDGI